MGDLYEYRFRDSCWVENDPIYLANIVISSGGLGAYLCGRTLSIRYTRRGYSFFILASVIIYISPQIYQYLFPLSGHLHKITFAKLFQKKYQVKE